MHLDTTRRIRILNIDNTCNDDTSFNIRQTNTIDGTVGNRQRKFVLIMNEYN